MSCQTEHQYSLQQQTNWCVLGHAAEVMYTHSRWDSSIVISDDSMVMYRGV